MSTLGLCFRLGRYPGYRFAIRGYLGLALIQPILARAARLAPCAEVHSDLLYLHCSGTWFTCQVLVRISARGIGSLPPLDRITSWRLAML